MKMFKSMVNYHPYLTKDKLYDYNIIRDTMLCERNYAEFISNTGELIRLMYPFDHNWAIEYQELPKRITIL